MTAYGTAGAARCVELPGTSSGRLLASTDLDWIRRLRAANQPGRIHAFDSRARPITIRVEDLLEDPDVLGYGIDLTDDDQDQPSPP